MTGSIKYYDVEITDWENHTVHELYALEADASRRTEIINKTSQNTSACYEEKDLQGLLDEFTEFKTKLEELERWTHYREE